ncbi:uncharacterized protein FMAN_15514 [Fusarium mangiferae]|uniref:Uncharacterized protein n=1 Tax=Fusarium mangiferae TaxID=192010 RepID=A0A1L7UPU4_FUSMA|nr:uncharacterized protein FMAN_15514 [Fusarium mangiferae]CVL09356.1 uncharacterized protein FMAN_15514 [Fusarium mangiferae]
MAASAPALPAPKGWPQGQPYSVVTNNVFQELERQGVILKETCYWAPIEAYHDKGEYLWIPQNEIIWCIPGSEGDIQLVTGCTLAFAGMFQSLQPLLFVYQSPTGCTNEARCVTALINHNGDKSTPKILGYDKGKDYDMWIDLDSNDYDGQADLGGFPTRIVDQYGYITRTLSAPTRI